ncbi:MAG: UDP-glucose 4-epimerase [Solirubrobacteraceae bacterium]|nr:UDP-glucose 4-epimerase [Solirubrobacteraceae bacterium]
MSPTQHMPSGEGPMTVLVTGGAGFVGSHVVDQLIAAGHTPVIYDARHSDEPSHAGVAQVRGDLCDLDTLAGAMGVCDVVIHLAAAADVNEVCKEPIDAEQRNARGTVNVLEAARRSEVSRVIYASTIWVYSDTPAELHEESLALQPPAHLYTATKLAGELYCRSYRELYDVESTILRFGIPYGPRARPAAVIPAFVGKALAGQPLTIAGDGSQSRRFVYVEDLAEGVVKALAPVAANRTYNLVSNEDVTIKEIAETVRRIVGDVAIEHVPGRAGDFAGVPACGERAAADLGWRPSTPFSEGVRRYVAWHREAAEQAAAAPAHALRHGLATLLGRAALALVWAAATAALIIGVITLAPVGDNFDTFDVFSATLLVLLPLVLAGGFVWEEARARRLRATLWTAALVCLAMAIVPSAPVVDRVADGHAIVLALFALSAAAAAQFPGRQAPLRAWLAAAGN